MQTSSTFPAVAVITPTFNRQAKLFRFLDVIAQQTYPNLQIIIIDSGSSDGTPTLVRDEFPHVTLLEVSDRNFWAGATNAGVKLAIDRQVDFILTINDDAVISPNHIECLVALAQQHCLEIVGNRIDYLEPSDRVWSLGTYTDWGTDRFLKIAYNNVELANIPDEVLSQELIAVDALPGNGVTIARSVFERVGLYDDKFCPHYHADSELIMRAKQLANIDAWVAPQIVLRNDFSEEQKQVNRRGIAKLLYIFFNPKSHLFAPAILSIIWQYCPRSQKTATLFSLVGRFNQMKRSQEKWLR
jgi:GT2 family glycosyltransferase